MRRQISARRFHPSPRPGFDMDRQRNCAPFVLNVPRREALCTIILHSVRSETPSKQTAPGPRDVRCGTLRTGPITRLFAFFCRRRIYYPARDYNNNNTDNNNNNNIIATTRLVRTTNDYTSTGAINNPAAAADHRFPSCTRVIVVVVLKHALRTYHIHIIVYIARKHYVYSHSAICACIIIIIIIVVVG